MDNNKFVELAENEMMDVEAGGVFVGILIGVGCVAALGLGIYNGYKDTKDQKK